MEKHLDTPGVLEEAKRRYIAALELQKRSIMCDISLAQRKLVQHFQHKLKTSAMMAKRHQAWRNETKMAKHGSRERRWEEESTNNVDSLMAKRNSRPWLNADACKSNRRPKTAGARIAPFRRQFEIDADAQSELNQSRIILASRKSHVFDKHDAPNKCGKVDRKSFILDEKNGVLVSKRKVDSHADKPKSNAMQENGKGHFEKELNTKPSINRKNKEAVDYFSTVNLDKRKVVARQTIKKDCRVPIAFLEIGAKTKNQTMNIEETCKSKHRDRERDNGEWKRPSNMNESTSDNKSQISKRSTSAVIQRRHRHNLRPQTAPNIHSNHQNDIKAHLRPRGKTLSTVETNDTSQGCEEFRKRGMSCEMRSWICDIQQDVERVLCPETDDNHDSKIPIGTTHSEHSLKNENSVDSALEKFEAIFNNIYVNHHDYSFYEKSVGPVEKLDIASLYLKSAVADSQKRAKQAWNLRDPRNIKLQPNIFL